MATQEEVTRESWKFTTKNGGFPYACVENEMNKNGKTAASEPAIEDAVDRIQTRQEFVDFAQMLGRDASTNHDQWENRDLTSYMAGLAGFVTDMDGYYQNRGESIPEQPTWKMLGQILLAARVYE